VRSHPHAVPAEGSLSGVLMGLLEANSSGLAGPLLQLLFGLAAAAQGGCLQGGLEPRSATKHQEGNDVCNGCGTSIRPQPHCSSRELNGSRHGGQQAWADFSCLTACDVALCKQCCSLPWPPGPSGPVACPEGGTPGIVWGLPNPRRLLTVQQKHLRGVAVP